MPEWIGEALASARRGEALAMVTIVGAQGSTPRDLGARMLVWPDRFTGTIGGGSLERQGLDQARKLLTHADRRHALQDYPLGPLLGQCCGGHVRLLVERVDAESLDWLEPAAQAREPFALTARFEDGGMTRAVEAVVAPPSDSPRLPIPEVRRVSETIRPALPRLVIFGAGHVGQAVARAFAPLPFHLDWLASREDLRPEASGTRATILTEDELQEAVEAAPADTLFAIFTHSHDLDYRLTRAVLARADFRYLGLIGSRTKRRRFEGRLRDDGVTDAELASLTCPIGIAELKSKAPAVIAISLAAELLKLTEDPRRMIAELEAWANLAIRWLHLVAGIAWIGSSFYFMWLDSHLKPPRVPRGEGVAGELWSVHSGGFYHQMKFMVAPGDMPEDLHWFKWEAYTTWISGFLLLSLIFYVGADLNLIDKSKFDLATWQAIALGLGSLVVGWLVYDGLCRSPIGQNLKAFSVIWFLGLVAAGYGLTRVFSDLGAFMHVGAIIGTVMAANVFLIIIPNQRKVVAQVLAGDAPNPALGKQAKQRSVHNNYMTLPVLFIMISNHYPMIFAAPLNWLWLAGLGIAGWTIRHFFNLKNAGRMEPQVLVYGALAFVTVAVLNVSARPKPPTVDEVPAYATVRAIVDRHCIACHAAHPTHRGVPVAPNGAMFDTDAGLQQHAEKIYARAVATQSMPQGNETQMTETERAQLGAWIKAGAKVGE